MRCRPPAVRVPAVQDWGRRPWFAPFLRRAFFLRRRFEDMDTSVYLVVLPGREPGRSRAAYPSGEPAKVCAASHLPALAAAGSVTGRCPRVPGRHDWSRETSDRPRQAAVRQGPDRRAGPHDPCRTARGVPRADQEAAAQGHAVRRVGRHRALRGRRRRAGRRAGPRPRPAGLGGGPDRGRAARRRGAAAAHAARPRAGRSGAADRYTAPAAPAAPAADVPPAPAAPPMPPTAPAAPAAPSAPAPPEAAPRVGEGERGEHREH